MTEIPQTLSEKWSRGIGRTWWLWLIAWPIIAVGTFYPAPRIPTLLKDSSKSFLPTQFPSHRALMRLREEFPGRAAASRAALIFVRDSGLEANDHEYIAAITNALIAHQDSLDWSVISPASSVFLKGILESKDGTAAIVSVDLPAGMLTHSTVNRVRQIESELAQLPPPAGLDVAMTGNAAMGRLIEGGTKRDVDLTTIWALLAVGLILLIVYRSAIAMLLPLVTIGFSLLLSLGALGWAAKYGWPINGLVQMFIVVMVLGCGVDYCMILFARFREKVDRMQEANESNSTIGGNLRDVAREAVIVALSRSTPAILAGAATVAAGLLALGLAKNRDYYTSGPTIALTILIATSGVLTLTPSLMILAGRWLLPRQGRVRKPLSEPRIWKFAAELVLRRPLTISAMCLLLLIPPAALSARITPLYDDLAEFPQSSNFVRGARLYYEHFFGGRSVGEMTILVTADVSLKANENEADLRSALNTVHDNLRRDFEIAYYRDMVDPLGTGERQETSGALASMVKSMAKSAYLGTSDKALRLDIGFLLEPRSPAAMDKVETIRAAIAQGIAASGLLQKIGGREITVDISGETAFYADQKKLREKDIRLITIAAITVIFLVLIILVRSMLQALILIGATLLTYYAACGATYLIVYYAYGLAGLNWKLNFLVFVIILSLGQDYNIFVVARIAEEMKHHPPREAVGLAIRRTGRVVSSCGIIMAATFASMFAGSLMLMKEFAIALSLGILVDTFVVRPLLVPSLILLFRAWNRRAAAANVDAVRRQSSLALH